MKKTTYVNYSILVILLLFGVQLFAQNFVPFNPRFNQDIKGDIVLIGNNILGPDNNAFNDGTVYNHRVDMRYIDIDSDPSTFSSSSADLVIANPSCYQIIHAGLYWSAVNSGTAPIDQVRLMGPTGGYHDVTGTVVFDAGTTSVDGGDSFPYACYADVTSIVTGLTNNLGTYTVANVSSAEGETSTFSPYNGTGHSAGWSLFIVYEDPTLPGKSITSFDGFSAISVPGGNSTLDIPVSGFRTLPAPQPVRANFAFATLEGDSPILGDRLRLNGQMLSTADRPATNFFNSSVTQLSATPVNNRVPNSSNTLGFDTGVMVVPNPGNTVIANDATSATVRLETSGDTFFPYFFALAVDIIEPNIVLTKIVEDTSGNNIGGQVVNLGDELNYIIGFQNTGNDNATNFIIRDVLPVNIIFNYPADIVSLPPGVTVQSYNAATREIVFQVDNSVVEEFDPALEIRFRVEVVSSCSLLDDACSNIISNQAYATYNGTLNPAFTISDDPSINNNTGCLLTPGATNFLSDLNCQFREEVILCGDTVELRAGDGYDSYTWSTSSTGTPVIGTGQTLTVNAIGTYYVHNAATAPCQSIDQIFDVITYGAGVPNPVIPFADEVVICPNDGKELPNFFLCGGNDSRIIQTGITDTSSMIWERLDETSCSAVINQDCANEDAACTWNQVGTGPDYTIDTAGQYRLTLNYTGGCFNQYYFNVYENVLVPTVTTRDIICSTPGEIVVGGVPSGYEYSIDGVNFQPSNTIVVNTAGIYTVYVRQIGVSPNPCIFEVPDVQIRDRNFSVSTTITQPLCNGDLGNVVLAANDVRPQYFFSIYQGATLINSVGPITPNNYTFSNLSAGTYTVNVSTEDGCTYTGDIDIIEPPILTATAAVTQPLTCTNGEITVYPNGGTAPYFYFINGSSTFQTIPTIDVVTAGTYNVLVVDSNNCTTNVSIDIDAIPPPVFNISSTDILCADDPNSGTLDVNVTNANGNTLRYSIDNGVTYSNSPAFTGLTAGTYEVVVEYTYGTDICETTPQSVTINAVPALNGTATVTTPYTCTTSGTITVSGVTGGTAPYEYSLDGVNYQTSNTFPGLRNGTFTVTIRDASGCTFIITPVVVDPLNPPTDLDFSHTGLTCPTNTTTVILNTTGGIAPLEYQIIAPAGSATAYQSGNSFSGLAPGTYTFQVRDAYNCEYSESYTIDPLPSISVVGQVIEDVSCFGALDGEATFTVANTTSFTYTINGGTAIAGTSLINLTGLAAGTYTVEITDTVTNCTASDVVTINTPSASLNVSANTSPITCISGGSATITATNGWGSYTYEIEQPDSSVLGAQSSPIFTNLTQVGTYTVTVTDGSGCTATTTFSLSTPVNPTATIDASSNFCYTSGTGASLVVNASGGNPPYNYSINGGPFVVSNSFTNLGPGTYDIIVRDAFGCTFNVPTQTIEDELLISTTLTKDLDCTVSGDAVISGTIAGGASPYTYRVSYNSGAFGTSTAVVANTFTFSTPNDGTYEFEITDALGCTVVSAVTTVDVLSLPEITSVIQTQDILCNGDSNAAIDITINNAVGTPPFTINVNNDSTGINYGTQTSGLPAGDYTITLTDGNSCTDTATITILEPTVINPITSTIPITCQDDGTGTGTNVTFGSVIVNSVTGGTAPYTYHVTGSNGYSAFENNATGSTSVTFDVVDFGNYTLSVTDSNGCSVLRTNLQVAAPPDDLDILVNAPPADCSTGGTANVSVGTSGGSNVTGSGPFYFAIYTGVGMVWDGIVGGSATWQLGVGSPASTTFNNLIPGATYTFIVYDDDTKCYYYQTSTLPIPTNSTLATSALVANNITCTGSADGSVSVDITDTTYGVPTPVTYEIFNALSVTTTGITGSGTVPANGTLSVTNLGPLPVGSYIVVVTEDTGATNDGCSVATTAFDIIESAIALSLSAQVDRNANCNPNSGLISAVAQGGTAPYEYQITTTSAAPAITDPSWASANTFNVNANTYYVHVKDAYNCIRTTAAIVLDADPEPVVAAVLTNQCAATEGNFEIDVTLPTAGIAPYSFSIDGGAFQTRTAPFTINNLTSGTHTIEVRDVNGCGNQVSVVIEPPVSIVADITALPTCDDDDGQITITGSGGTGTYSYSISPNPASISLAGNVYSGVPSGTYTITITDVTTTCTADVTVTLDAATPVTFTPIVTDVSCTSGNNGTITIDLPISNDNPPYTYEIIAPIVVGPQNSNIFTGLTANTYTVRVNSGRGCSATANVNVGEPALLTVLGSATDFACNAGNIVNTSTLTISEIGGTAPYTYSIDGSNYFNSNLFDIVDTGSVQNITVYVRDANNCIATNTVSINPLPALTAASVATATPIDCNNTGSVVINVTGGSGNFTYQMLPSGTPQASNTFNISAPGDYYFQVNDVTTGCNITTAAFTLAPYETIEAVATPLTDITCLGDTNGSFELNISGFTGNYTYEVFDTLGTSVIGSTAANTSTNPITIGGLVGGNYYVEVIETDSPFCTVISNTFTIDSPGSALALTATETSNVTCDNNVGTITAVANGGWGSYEYELTGAATVAYSSSATFTGLSAGNYVVNVRDAGGCVDSFPITLDLPTPINASITALPSPLACFGDENASITVSGVTGGQGSNYSYTLNRLTPTISTSGPKASNVFSNLGVGTYNVTVTDSYNCSFTTPDVTITEPTQLDVSLVRATGMTCTTDASLTLSATGGTGTYEYSDTANFTSILGSFSSSTTFTVTPGDYMFYVRDANGCISSVSNQITIDPLPTLTLDLDTTNATVNCAGDTTGVIIADAIGGLGSYVYTLQDTSGNPITPVTQNSPGVFTELPVGDYQVYVESGDCLYTSATISITEPTLPLEVNFSANNVSCFGENNGSLEIIATGGTGIIKYAISPQLNQFFDEPIFEDLAPGSYQGLVQDELGCFVLFDFTIDQPAPVILTIVPNSIMPELCSGDMNGEFSIDISGGTLPYSVALDDVNGTYTTGIAGQTIFDFPGLTGGDHMVYIRDAEGCESEWNITFPESVLLDPQVRVEYCTDISDATSNTVTITIDASVDPNEVDYSLDGVNFQSSNVFIDVAPGLNRSITVRHTNGCEQVVVFDVNQYNPLQIALSDGGINEIEAQASGGSGGYEYAVQRVNEIDFEPYQDTGTFVIYESGEYTVTVTDSNGCVATATRYFEYIDVCITNYFTPNGDGRLDTWGPGCVTQYRDMTFDIFDRYGRKVVTLGVNDKWDGRYNGRDLPTGDYWYVVKLNDPRDDRSFVGHFTLYR